MDDIKKLAKQVAGYVKGDKTKSYDTSATVTKVTDDAIYVHIPGGVSETPVKKTIDAKAGDTVQVHVGSGTAWLTGNRTAPPTDDAEALKAKKVAKVADQNATKAKTTADEAQATANAVSGIANTALSQAQEAKQIADDTEQHFWFTETGTDTGAHIAEITKDEWDVTPSGGNLLARSNGIAVREGMTELATFGASGAQIGISGESHIEIDYHSMQLIDKEGNAYFHVSDLRSNHAAVDEYGEGFYAVVTDTFTGDGSQTTFFLSNISLTNNYKVYVNGVEESNISKNGTSFIFATAPAVESIVTATYPTEAQTLKAYTAGLRGNGKIGVMSFTEGNNTIASGSTSHAEGYHTTASGSASHAEGIATKASGDYAHAEGIQATASGYASHAEGSHTTASGVNSHAEGYNITASGYASHAEGSHTTASGSDSHAEGESTTASGMGSHVQNFRTIAGYNYQTSIGKYNDNQSANAFEIGNGTADNARSNAFEVAWTGDTKAYGDIEDGSGNVLSDKADATAIPTATSDLTNDSGFIASDSSGNVTISGKATLGAINGDSLFAYTSVSVTTSSISANSSGEATSSASTLANHYPLAITDVNISTGVASLRRFYFSTQQTGRAVVKIGVQNDGTSAKTISATAKILWVKTSV